MAIYVDNMNASYGRMKMCHMVADTEEELEGMALKIGVNTKWWQHRGTRKSHFDICLSKKQKAIRNGAVEVTIYELGYMLSTRKRCEDVLPKPRGKGVIHA